MKTTTKTTTKTTAKTYAYVHDAEKQKKYDQYPEGRLRTFKQYCNNRIAPLTSKDDFSVEDIAKLEYRTGAYCPCCGRLFDGIKDIAFSHVNQKGRMTYKNIQLLCQACNNTQKDFTFNFLEFREKTGVIFLAYFLTNPNQVIKSYKLSNEFVARVWKRIDKLNKFS